MSVILKYGKNEYVIEDKIAEKVGITKRCVKKYISILKSWKLVEVKYGRGGGIKFNKEGLPDCYIFFCKRGTNSRIEQNNKNKKEINTFSVEKNKEISKKIDGIKEKMPMRGCSGVFGAVLVPRELLREFYETVNYAKDCFIAKNYITGDYVAVSFKFLNWIKKTFKVSFNITTTAIYAFADWIFKKMQGLNRIFNIGRSLLGFLKKDLTYNKNIYEKVASIPVKKQTHSVAGDIIVEKKQKNNGFIRKSNIEQIGDVIKNMLSMNETGNKQVEIRTELASYKRYGNNSGNGLGDGYNAIYGQMESSFLNKLNQRTGVCCISKFCRKNAKNNKHEKGVVYE